MRQWQSQYGLDGKAGLGLGKIMRLRFLLKETKNELL